MRGLIPAVDAHIACISRSSLTAYTVHMGPQPLALHPTAVLPIVDRRTVAAQRRVLCVSGLYLLSGVRIGRLSVSRGGN